MSATIDRTATVLIPAAGRVPEGILSYSSIATPAMIPVAGAPVIHWTLTYLIDLGLTRFRVAVPTRGLSIEDYVECTFGRVAEVEWVVPSADRGVGFTVAEMLTDLDGPVLVVLGDTLFEFGDGPLDLTRCNVLTGVVDESYRWCIVESSPDGDVKAWHDKVEGLEPPLDAACGVYWLPDARRATAALASWVPDGVRLEMSDVVQAAAGVEGVHAVRAGTWRDCGNPDTQEAARRQILQERAFNSLAIDDRRGTITKRSEHREKLIDEIDHIRLLPRDLTPLFPRIIDFSTEWEDPWVELEYYGYPTLTELFLYERLPPSMWRSIFLRLGSILDLFGDHPRPVHLDDVRGMYITKTRQRLASDAALVGLGELISAPSLRVNGAEVPNLISLWDEIDAAVEDRATLAEGSVIHGDLCFSNILYDVRTDVCKLIDPRGSFGRVGIFGDRRYDVAKLYHSVIAGYDLIVAGLFDLDVDGHEVSLSVHTTGLQQGIGAMFSDTLLAPYDEADIALITGLMFAGLPPLHYESPERQVALYVRGVQLISRGLGYASSP